MTDITATVVDARVVLTLPFRIAEHLTDVLAREWGDETAQEVRNAIYRHLHDPECEVTTPCRQCRGVGCDECDGGFVACTGCY